MVKGKTPSLLSKNVGKPSLSIVGRKSKCRRCRVVIIKGNQCVDISYGDYGSPRRYCLKCFEGIYLQTEKELKIIKSKFSF